jgi:hypothetical protein
MRTMPVELTSSVDVASTERAHRMHRRTSTDAIGRGLESMLCRRPTDLVDTSESEDTEEEEEL